MFPLGRIVATPAALNALEEANVSGLSLLGRHLRGDWGTIHPGDVGLNEEALKNGARIFSVYPLKTGEVIWVITEADRASTCLLLPDDY